MKKRRVRLDDDARADLRQIFRWIALRGAPASGRRYVARIAGFAQSLELAPERGTAFNDLRKGLRAIPFESVVLAVLVEDDTVVVLRVFHASQDWLKQLKATASNVGDY